MGEMKTAVKNRSDIDDAELIGTWLNSGYLSLAEVARIPAVVDISITADGLGELPSDLIAIDAVKLKTINSVAVDKGENMLDPISEYEIDDAGGTPTNYVRTIGKDTDSNDVHMLRLYPKSSHTVVATLTYFKYPAKMTGDTSSPSAYIPERYHEAIESYGIARAKEADEEYNESQHFMSQFEYAKEQLRRERMRIAARPRTVRARLYR